MLAKIMEQNVLPSIAQCAIPIATFDLWMCKISFDTCA
jgi:hypothetical protein